MRAVTVVSLDGPRAVRVADHPEPVAGDHQIVIATRAAGVAFPDVLATRGRYQIKPVLPFVPGAQAAGTVVSAPSGSGFRAGERVAAFTLFGAFAERIAVDPGQVFALPDALSWTAGAAAPLNYLTAEFVLTRRGRLAGGETVLVHGAAGGVGLATVQLAKALGARVIAVVSTPEKGTAARDSGADDVVAVDGFRAAVRELTDGRGVDLVIDPVGGDRFTDSLRSLAPGGRLLVVGFTAGEIPTVGVNRLLLNNIEVVGAAWGEYAQTNPGYAQRQWAALVPLFASGALRPHIGAVLPLEQAAEALSILDRRAAVGNVVLEIG